MAEYIEREAYLAELAKGTIITDDSYGMGIMAGIDFAMKKASGQPAADVTPVVRCKDCVVPHNKWTGCPMLNGAITPPDFYCSYGERKGGDG